MPQGQRVYILIVHAVLDIKVEVDVHINVHIHGSDEPRASADTSKLECEELEEDVFRCKSVDGRKYELIPGGEIHEVEDWQLGTLLKLREAVDIKGCHGLALAVTSDKRKSPIQPACLSTARKAGQQKVVCPVGALMALHGHWRLEVEAEVRYCFRFCPVLDSKRSRHDCSNTSIKSKDLSGHAVTAQNHSRTEGPWTSSSKSSADSACGGACHVTNDYRVRVEVFHSTIMVSSPGHGWKPSL